MTTAKKQLLFNGFMMNVVGHVSAGTVAAPDDRASEYTTLDYWLHIARLLDEAGFDAMFIADALGQIDVYQGKPDAALRTAAQSPVNDPLLLVSAMAAATRQLGFGITVSTTYEHPYLLARKFTTLDHLTKGRVAWNIVTSVLESAARNLGLEKQMDHDERYERAQEFLEVTYKLWEGSWEDDAVRRDREAGVYTDPAKVHPIRHQGRWFTVPDAHSLNPARSGRRCCSRQAPRIGVVCLPHRMPKSCSSAAPRRSRSRRISTKFAPWRMNRGAAPRQFALLPPSAWWSMRTMPGHTPNSRTTQLHQSGSGAGAVLCLDGSGLVRLVPGRAAQIYRNQRQPLGAGRADAH
ncbi:Nitrilotriacetate monooxygenase component A [Raoultella terrigena]|uniref:Nitrilotriacetate monooxygenase component A n=1 Tax=Raoultella terrigena TaxID=577 RepID=A0A3P8IRN1_RAOTE|nr:Nitrilotriacetate monooxygenase component A [Raoultella terrigena]